MRTTEHAREEMAARARGEGVFPGEEAKPKTAVGWAFQQTPSVGDENQLSSMEQMRSVIERVLDEEMGRNVPLAELAADPLKPSRGISKNDPDTGAETVLGRSWRFRTVDAPFNVNGILGRVDVGHFYNMVKATISWWRRHLTDLQANGDWQLAAWVARRSGLVRLSRVESNVPKAQWSKFIEGTGPGGGVDKPQDTVNVPATDDVVSLRLVWYDANHAEELDNWYLRTGKTDGTMHNWTTSGILPVHLKEERRVALDVIKATLAESGADLRKAAESKLGAPSSSKCRRLYELGMSVGEIAEMLSCRPEDVDAALEIATGEPVVKRRRSRKKTEPEAT